MFGTVSSQQLSLDEFRAVKLSSDQTARLHLALVGGDREPSVTGVLLTVYPHSVHGMTTMYR